MSHSVKNGFQHEARETVGEMVDHPIVDRDGLGNGLY
jgi:hypothetical protein